MLKIFVALGFAASLSVMGSYPVWAGDSEGPSIASLIAIGLADAPSNFDALRGALERQNDHKMRYSATKPDDVYYASCFVYNLKSDSKSDSKIALYSCNSTPRTLAPDVLFHDIEPLVRANIPSGYSSSGIRMVPKAYGSFPWEIWRRESSPDIILEVYQNSDGTSHYTLAVR